MLDYLHLGTYHDIPVCVYDAWINRTGILDTKRRLSGPEHIYINLNNLGRKYGQKTDIYVDHTHKEVEVTIIVKGHEHIAINGEERVLSPGDLYIVNPFDQHSGFYYHSPDAYPIYAYTAIFDISFFLPLIPERYSSVFGDIARGAARFRTFSFGEERLTPLFSRLSDAYLDRDTLRLLSGTYELLAELYDHFTDKSGTGLNPDQQFVIKLTELVDRRMAEELTTSSLSEELGYSKGHFCRRFRECFGVTFTEYLQNQRMTYAMSLYIEPDETLSDIAAKCGYADSQYFSRVFTKFAGMSPTKYFNMRRK